MKKSKILIAIVIIIAVIIMLLLILQKLDVIRISEKGVKLGNTVTGKIDDWVYVKLQKCLLRKCVSRNSQKITKSSDDKRLKSIY